jgi:hypothetical protein
MFNIKQVLLASATFGVVATIGAISPQSAQSAIVGGQVSGIWDYASEDGVIGPDRFNVGDAFTALYTYDDASIIADTRTTTIVMTGDSGSSSSIFTEYFRKVPLLSLVINSGSISQMFDLSTPSANLLSWYDSRSDGSGVPPSPPPGIRKSTNLFVNSAVFPNYNSFSASRDDFSINGTDFATMSYANVRLAVVSDLGDPNNFIPPTFVNTRDASANNFGGNGPHVVFSATDVPTPALLPGLIGLGLGMLRKRKALAAAEQAA